MVALGDRGRGSPVFERDFPEQSPPTATYARPLRTVPALAFLACYILGMLEKGALVKVGDSLGVVTHLQGELEVPDDHLGVWFEEVEGLVQKIKIVPEEYCLIQDKFFFYH